MVSVLLCPYACSCLFAPALVSPVCETQIVKEALSYLRKKVCSFVEKSLPRSPSSTSSHSVALRTAAAATTAVAAPFLVWPSPQSPYVEQCRSAIRRLIDYNILFILHRKHDSRCLRLTSMVSLSTKQSTAQRTAAQVYARYLQIM